MNIRSVGREHSSKQAHIFVVLDIAGLGKLTNSGPLTASQANRTKLLVSPNIYTAHSIEAYSACHHGANQNFWASTASEQARDSIHHGEIARAVAPYAKFL